MQYVLFLIFSLTFASRISRCVNELVIDVFQPSCRDEVFNTTQTTCATFLGTTSCYPNYVFSNPSCNMSDCVIQQVLYAGSRINYTEKLVTIGQKLSYEGKDHYHWDNCNNCYHRTTKRSLTQLPLVNVDFKQPIFTITEDVPGPVIIWISKSSIQDQFNCSDTCTITVPEIYFINDMDIHLLIYTGSTLIYDKFYSISAFKMCPTPENPFTSVWVEHFKCTTHYGRFEMIMSMLGALVFLVIVILIGICISMMIYKRYCVYSPMIQQNFITETEDTEAVKYKTQYVSGKGWVKTMVMVIMFCAIISPVSAQTDFCGSNLDLPCQLSFSLNSKSISCESFNQTCHLEFNLLITFIRVGQTVCYDVVDPDTGDFVQKVSITWSIQKIHMFMEFMYSTSSWIPLTATHRDCPAVGLCSYYTGCPTNLDRSANGTFSGPVTLFPGDAGCYAVPGCAGEGCLYCANACLLVDYAFQAVDTIYDVYRAISYYQLPNFLLKTWDQTGETFCSGFELDVPEFTLIGGVNTPEMAEEHGSFRITSVSPVTRSLNPFITKYFICKDEKSECFFGDASPTNGPIAGLVGDIQAGTPTDLPEGVYRYPTGSVTILPQGSTATFVFPQPGARLLGTSSAYINFTDSVPLNIDGIELYVGNNQMYGYDKNAGPFTIGLSTIGDYEIQFENRNVCPVYVGNTEGLGCYDCTIGSTFNATLYSNCAEGFAIVRTNATYIKLGTQSVNLKNTAGSFRFYFESTIKTGSFNVDVYDGTHHVYFDVSFDLIRLSNVDPNNTQSTTPEIDHSGDGDFLDKLDFLPGWNIGKWFVVGAGVIIGIIILILVLVFLVRVV